MRELKFRGKSKETGEWIYGNYAKALVDVVDEKEIYKHYILKWDCIREHFDWNEVEAETVGQYIGFEDCESNEIYEGDIVEFEQGIGEVYYKEGQFVHGFREKISDLQTFRPPKRMWDRVKVIGNIHENPELLG